MRRRIGSIVAFAALAGLALYLATGLASVEPGEVVVVRRFGRVEPTPWRAGLHWGWPAGFERRDRVRIDAVRRLEVGLAGVAGPGDEPGAGEYLAGDLNLAKVRMVVQYRVADPVAYTLAVRDPERLLGDLAESSLARSLAHHGIDGILHERRVEVAEEARAELDRANRHHGLGLAVLGVSLTDVRPPVEVQPAFDDAQAARSEKVRRTNEARAYAGTTLSAATADAEARLDRAQTSADRVERLARARGERFLALLAEADRDRALTVRRIYLDALRNLLPRVGRMLVLAPEEPIDLSLFGRD